MKKIICITTGETAYNYKQYLKTKHWANIRLDLRDEKCVVCNFGKTQVHHINYDRLGCEEPTDLIVLCRKHHKNLHRKEIKKRTAKKRRTKQLRERNKKIPYKIKQENGISIKVY